MIVLGIVIGVPVFAATNPPAPVGDAAKINCVKLAVVARELRLMTNLGNYQRAVGNAYMARASALDQSYATTSPAGVKVSVKNAWATFKTTTRSASKSWKTERNATWKAYKDAAKICKAPSGVSDSNYSGYEPSL